MEEILKVKVVTPSGSQFEGEVRSFTARSELGEFCLLPNHRPILSTLIAGPMMVERSSGEKEIFALNGGFLEAGPDHVHVITEHCLDPAKIDRETVLQRRDEVEKEIEKSGVESAERTALENELQWIGVQLDVVQG